MTAQVHWSMSEKTFVVQLINDRYDELYCRFKGATLGGKKKEQTWQEVADTFNSSSVAQCSRTVRQIKDMYAQLKCRAKKKESDRKETGGGPPAVLTTVEDLVIDGIRDKPQLIGIPGGIDSGDCYACVADVAEMADTDEASAKCTLTVAECTSKPATASNVATSSTSRPSKESLKKRKRNRCYEEELLELETRRAQAELDLLLQRQQQEKQLHDLRIKVITEAAEQERQLFTLKKELLNSNIKSAMDQGLLLFES
ncbi:uncharacterized protein LOC127876471 isoform X1 [Dreissena polymorpha]|nr:uncharacterized protein LOC127847586 isoform X1 [Dreissena polymorpha]XP_052235555.1 uncharacterized protein LOC127847586 isoform X2 [Dreissena polymorpha]XP_052235556.1 uncharacterized protein LOC127847586 isoform X3 [Dreissena polymorpha]XP_052277741.1 uncharacterized protein LOC127876471 isoform X1 [Dreissena polymorpha]